VTFLVTDAATAHDVALEHLGPDAIQAAAKQDPPTKAPRPRKGFAVAGWGNFRFRFNDWLNGTADVVVDDQGHFTVIGEIRPDKEVLLMRPKDFTVHLLNIPIRAEYGLPYVGGIGLEADILLDFNATLGPAKLYNIVADGRYSTDPRIAKAFSIAASFNLSAYAELALTAKGAVVLTILSHDIKAGAGVTAKAGLRAYVDARPTIGYRETAPLEQGGKGEFYFKGHAEAAAQPFLGLDGFLFIELSTPWWSPISDHTWTWPIGSLEYDVPGSFGIGMDVDHVIGSGKVPDVQFSKVSFDSDKFMSDALDKKMNDKSHGEQKRQGTWKGVEPQNPVPAPQPKKPAPPKSSGRQKRPATGGQSANQRKGNDPAVARAWKSAMAHVRAVAERSKRHPFGLPEIKDAVAELKKSHNFSNIGYKRAGNDWILHLEMGLAGNFPIKGRAPGAQASLNIDEPFDLQKEHHTLRGHIEGGRVTFLMASEPFKFVKERVAEIRHHYVDKFLPETGKKDAAANVGSALDRVVAIEESIVARADAAATPAARETITRQGIATVGHALQLVNSLLARAAGEWAKLRPGDTVVIHARRSQGPDRYGTVTELMKEVTTGGRTFYGLYAAVGIRNPVKTFLAYENYGALAFWEAKRLNIPGEPGSREAPYQIDWPKPASRYYPVFYLGGLSSTKIPQHELRTRFLARQPDPNGNPIREFHPHAPNDGVVGIKDPWRLDVGTKLGPLPPPGTTTPGGEKLNSILRPYGYSATHPVTGVPLETDHVHEIQVGGADVIQNLWPLDRSINKNSGDTIARSAVEYPDGSGKTILLQDLKKDTKNLNYLKIKSVR
jgi:hypothetical protein